VPLDLFPLLLPVVADLYAFIHGFEAAHRVQATILLLLVPVLMWTIWGWFMWQRKQWLDRCTWFPKYGCLIDTEKSVTSEGYLLPPEQEWDEYLASVARTWAPFHPQADLLLRRFKVIFFKKGLDERPTNPSWKLVKGLTVWGGGTLYVDYNTKLDPLEHTALAHELGHVIHGLATGQWFQDEHHDFMKRNHLR